ncbi:hypothetical protein ZIOFF_020962 [Zingiber officinale]|uniref:Peptidase M24 domain-containing protein n=1 Tax=Zingiber officinale TaxID=94328 RepID=A0A8J5HJA5_ZINOF|nr:hypothetical protein ZIOFF_020962 [Zingiber officinale]
MQGASPVLERPRKRTRERLKSLKPIDILMSLASGPPPPVRLSPPPVCLAATKVSTMLEEKEALFLLIVGGVVDAGGGIVCLEEEALSIGMLGEGGAALLGDSEVEDINCQGDHEEMHGRWIERYNVSHLCKFWQGIPKIEPSSDLQNIVEIKTPEQIERMRETCRIAREVLDAAARIIRPGITTDEIDDVVHQATIAADRAALEAKSLKSNPMILRVSVSIELSFLSKILLHVDLLMKSSAMGFRTQEHKKPNCYPIDHFDIWIHHSTIIPFRYAPKSVRLEDGDIVNVDVTVYYKGVHGDLNETFFVGEVDEASRHLVRCTYECLEKAISIDYSITKISHQFELILTYFTSSSVKPGIRFRDVGEVINRHATMSGLAVVKSYCGHVAVDAIVALTPEIGNKAVGIMKAGQTFTIEPMINAGIWRDRLWPDGWTAVTADGKRSAQFEHTLLVSSTFILLNVLDGKRGAQFEHTLLFRTLKNQILKISKHSSTLLNNDFRILSTLLNTNKVTETGVEHPGLPRLLWLRLVLLPPELPGLRVPAFNLSDSAEKGRPSTTSRPRSWTTSTSPTINYSLVFTFSQGSTFTLLAETYPFRFNKKLLTMFYHDIEEANLWQEVEEKGLRSRALLFPTQSKVTEAKYSYQSPVDGPGTT